MKHKNTISLLLVLSFYSNNQGMLTSSFLKGYSNNKAYQNILLPSCRLDCQKPRIRMEYKIAVKKEDNNSAQLVFSYPVVPQQLGNNNFCPSSESLLVRAISARHYDVILPLAKISSSSELNAQSINGWPLTYSAIYNVIEDILDKKDYQESLQAVKTLLYCGAPTHTAFNKYSSIYDYINKNNSLSASQKKELSKALSECPSLKNIKDYLKDLNTFVIYDDPSKNYEISRTEIERKNNIIGHFGPV